jgi:hypothetical protein
MAAKKALDEKKAQEEAEIRAKIEEAFLKTKEKED